MHSGWSSGTAELHRAEVSRRPGTTSPDAPLESLVFSASKRLCSDVKIQLCSSAGYVLSLYVPTRVRGQETVTVHLGLKEGRLVVLITA